MGSIYRASAANVGNLEFTTKVKRVQKRFLTRFPREMRGDEDPASCRWSGHHASPVCHGRTTVVVSLIEIKEQRRQFTSRKNRNRMHYLPCIHLATGERNASHFTACFAVLFLTWCFIEVKSVGNGQLCCDPGDALAAKDRRICKVLGFATLRSASSLLSRAVSLARLTPSIPSLGGETK